jgi:hypothetical protein
MIEVLKNVDTHTMDQGLNLEDLNPLAFKNTGITKITMDIKSATTPPNLLGIARRMAYANRKYHSG